MDLQELLSIVKNGETDTVALKRAAGQRTDIAKTVCAMLNTKGGLIAFGVTEGGEPLGLRISTRGLEDIKDELKRLEPSVSVDIETIPWERGMNLLAIQVEATGGPYAYDGRPYVRRDARNQVMTRWWFEKLASGR